MSKQEKIAEVGYKVYNAITECDDMGQALTVLTDTIAATVAANIEDKADRALIIDACIKRLRGYKKQMQQ